MDSNGDGIGDLKGITGRLDYLKELGVETIWLSPVNESPNVDNGYDISDYYRIDPQYGTNEDFDELLAEAKKRGISVLMDLVVNHCSTEHEWFRKAVEDPEGEYASYFYFRKGKEDGSAPNNWRSVFGGPAWEKVPGSDYYYLHVFTAGQADLNWENEKLREEIYDMMNYWLDKGVAGFRIDAINYLKKEPGLPSFPADDTDGLVTVKYGSLYRPGIEKFLTEMRERTYGRDALTVGEVAGVPDDELLKFVSLEDGYFSMIFDFSFNQLDCKPPLYSWCDRKEWDADELKRNMFATQMNVQPDGWIGDVLESHDSPRSMNYYLPEEGRNFLGGSMLAVMSLGRRGTPFIYQGQELGMDNQELPSIDCYDDCSSHNEYSYALSKGFTPEQALHFVHLRSRDNARYPFSWDDSENAGFMPAAAAKSDFSSAAAEPAVKSTLSSAEAEPAKEDLLPAADDHANKPWLPVTSRRSEINAAKEMAEPRSLFHVYQFLLGLRKDPATQETMINGRFVPYLENQHHLIAYKRCLGEDNAPGTLLFACNYQNEPQQMELPGKCRVLLDNYTFGIPGNTSAREYAEATAHSSASEPAAATKGSAIEAAAASGKTITLLPWQALVLELI